MIAFNLPFEHAPMRFLVTGSTGLVGNNVVRQLLAEQASVRVLVRAQSDSRPLAGLNVEKCIGDVQDAAAVEKACEGIDYVIHCAGYVHIGWSHPEIHQQVNVEGTQNVVRAARKAGARMVYVSSINALGVGSKTKPATEEKFDDHVVLCPYVVSKRAAEKIVFDAVKEGLEAVVVNPAFMLGPWDWKPSSGKMLLEIVGGYMIFAPWGGNSLCDVRDVAQAIIQAARTAPAGRRYLLAGHNLTFMETWTLFTRLFGGCPPISRVGPINNYLSGLIGDAWYHLTGHETQLNSAAMRMSDQYHFFDSSRAIDELGYHIRPVEETVQVAWEWFRENGYLKPRHLRGTSRQPAQSAHPNVSQARERNLSQPGARHTSQPTG